MPSHHGCGIKPAIERSNEPVFAYPFGDGIQQLSQTLLPDVRLLLGSALSLSGIRTYEIR